MREVRIKLVSNDPVMDYAISKPEDAIVVMQSLIGDMANEYFAAVYLNTKNKPLDFMIVNIAGTDYSRIDPATVIKGALLQNATKVMLFHNHPSGELTPSQADLISTQKMVIAAKLNGIEVLDHVIVGEDGFHSFAESGQMDLLSSEYLDGLKELRELSAEEFNTRYSFEARELDLNNELSI